jgi:uncharacterized protein (DUF697 family)
VLVSGMLAEQLARQLGADAEPGAMVVGDRDQLHGASVLVRVVAGELGAADDELLAAAERARVPAVLVQIWPQEDWTPPFVRTPFVVECKAGAGFPVPEIAARVVEAVEDPIALALRVPALREAAARSTTIATAIRVGLLGTLWSSAAARPLITLEQARLVASLGVLHGKTADAADLRSLGAAAAAVAGGGFALREVARAARRVLPRPVADAAVAAGATYLIGVAARRMGSGLPRSA